MTSRLYTKYN